MSSILNRLDGTRISASSLLLFLTMFDELVILFLVFVAQFAIIGMPTYGLLLAISDSAGHTRLIRIECELIPHPSVHHKTCSDAADLPLLCRRWHSVIGKSAV